MPWTIDIPEPVTHTADFSDPRSTGTDDDRSGLAELSEFYRQLGFDAGYGQAARDQLEFSVVTAEQVLREHATAFTNPTEARRLLYAFISRIDRRLGLFANPAASKPAEAYMEGGLGI